MATWQLDAKSKPFLYKVLAIDVSEIIKKYNLTKLTNYDEIELESFVKYFDPLELLRDTKDTENELVTYQLENNMLAIFLEKNDPKTLIGIRARYRKNASLYKIDTEIVQKKTVEIRSIPSTSLSFGESLRNKEFELNVQAKSKLSELSVNDLERRITEIEKNTDQDLRNLRSYGEELKIRIAESELAQKNFSLYFLDKEEDRFFLEKAQPIQVFRKWQKYFGHWKAKSSGLLHLISLKMGALQTSCHSMQSNITTRTEMSTYTTEIDYDNLVIVRKDMLKKLNGLLSTIKCLEFSNQKASHSFLDALKLLKKNEFAFKDLKHRCDELNRHMSRLDREIYQIETTNAKDREILMSIENRISRFIAPNIDEYIEKKDELATAIKEEKILNRKVNILNMKLTNLKRKLLKLNQSTSKKGKKGKPVKIVQ